MKSLTQVIEGTAATTTAGGSGARVRSTQGEYTVDERYEDLGLIAEGGFGEVRRVRDKKLDRIVAMKIVQLPSRLNLRTRLSREAVVGARLNHPGIVALYDFGETPYGQIWFTMPEVRGRTFAQVIDAVHAEEVNSERYAAGQRRAIDALARVCQAAAFAHRNGIVHRDLKPENILLGDLGEVLIVDWGLAELLETPPTDDAAAEVVGTPAYMPPEQARGDTRRSGPRVDVYALGATLYQALAGSPPFTGSSNRILALLLAGPPPSLNRFAHVAPALVQICEKAMAREPNDRFDSAEALAQALFDWLDGMNRRKRALAVMPPNREDWWTHLTSREQELRDRANAVLANVAPHAGAEVKSSAWEMLDEADRIAEKRRGKEAEWLTAVHSALAIDPELPEAHALLADQYQRDLTKAELEGKQDEAARYETLLRVHDRGRYSNVLTGDGMVHLESSPSGANVTLYRVEPEQRRLVLKDRRQLGNTPLLNLTLPRGSYVAELHLPSFRTVRYPFLVRRGEEVRGGYDTAVAMVELPRQEDLDSGEVLVPGGWTWVGGDAQAPDSLPGQRVWIDSFVIDRFPVTNEQYLAFLNTLVKRGSEAEALAACPRLNLGAGLDTEDRLAFARRPDGLFDLPISDNVLLWHMRAPVTLISWRSALNYAAYRSEVTGYSYRLPNELEREKAARGADGRVFSWGNWADASFACMLESHPAEPGRALIHSYPVDESVYGVRGLCGNTRDFCMNLWKRRGPELVGDRLFIEFQNPEPHEHISVRGGAWSSVVDHCRAAARFGLRPDHRRSTTGLRLVRCLKKAQ
ncbi:MAG: SUMF1/EgtB/PvdO family nonheme iron enzyme [Polyangiaceae bacterium]|nr:SUMF1/EgtB/PvdO family nonheme iron enzyme [Polyangiaceae bacterium]